MVGIERSHRARAGTSRRLSTLAIVLVLMTLTAGCSGNVKDKLASVASSLSNRPTQGSGPTNEAPSSPEGATTGGTGASSGSATASSGVSPWVWVVLALAVIGVIGVVVSRARGRTHAATRASSRKAFDAYAAGVALHDRIQAELLSAPADGPLVSAAGVIEAQHMIDGLTASVGALSLEASQDTVKAAAGRVSLGLAGLRSALQLAGSTGPASDARVAVSTTLRDRLEDFTRSLTALRDAAQGR